MSVPGMAVWLQMNRALDDMGEERRRLVLPVRPAVDRSRYGRGPALCTVVLRDEPLIRAEGGAGWFAGPALAPQALS